MQPEEARALLQRGMAFINARDLDGLLELVHPDARWYSPPGTTAEPVYQGPEGVREFITEWLEPWSDFHQELLDLRLDGDRILARVRVRARGSTSGVEFDDDVGYLMEADEGQMTRFELFTNYEDAAAAF